MASSEPTTPWHLLHGELGLSRMEVNQSLLRRHRKGMDCSSSPKQEVCRFRATQALPLSLAGRTVKEIRYHFTHDQLTRITGYFAPNSETDDFKEKMQQRYGKPTRTSSRQLQWHRGKQRLTLDATLIQLEAIPAK